MDTLEFIASIVKSLAWPLAFVATLLILRRPIAGLIPLLERLKFRGLELDFRKQVHEVAAEAEEVLPAAPKPAIEATPEIEEIAQVSPRAAIVESWLAVEAAAGKAVKKRLPGVTSTQLKSQPQLAQALRQAEILSTKQVSLFDQLRYLRNAAVHAQNITLTPSTAVEYAKTARRLVGLLEGSA
jgi:hypothetical protein